MQKNTNCKNLENTKNHPKRLQQIINKSRKSDENVSKSRSSPKVDVLSFSGPISGHFLPVQTSMFYDCFMFWKGFPHSENASEDASQTSKNNSFEKNFAPFGGAGKVPFDGGGGVEEGDTYPPLSYPLLEALCSPFTLWWLWHCHLSWWSWPWRRRWPRDDAG